MRNICTHNPHKYILNFFKIPTLFKDWKMVKSKKFYQADLKGAKFSSFSKLKKTNVDSKWNYAIIHAD